MKPIQALNMTNISRYLAFHNTKMVESRCLWDALMLEVCLKSIFFYFFIIFIQTVYWFYILKTKEVFQLLKRIDMKIKIHLK